MKRITQKDEVLRYMKKHGTISTLECSTKLFIVDLQAVIRDLKKVVDISWKWTYTTNIYGRPVRYKKYRLSKPCDRVDGFTRYRRN